MTFNYIDIHSHVSFKEYDKDRDDVIARMREHNVATITVGVDIKSSKHAIEIAEQYREIYVSVGHHPEDTPNENFNERDYEEIVSHPRVVSIGECGLDYFRAAREHEDFEKEKKRQRDDFERQIEFALKYDKPLMLHVRPTKGSMDAYEDALDLLHTKKRANSNLRGNFHFFVGDVYVARKIFDIDFTTSFSGVITFADEFEEVVRFAPLEMIHVETDSPYAAPTPYRGKRNEPAHVVEIVKKVAQIKGESVNWVQDQLVVNANRVFKLVLNTGNF